MQKWEYKKEMILWKDMEKQLNRWGQEGWEMVSMFHSNTEQMAMFSDAFSHVHFFVVLKRAC